MVSGQAARYMPIYIVSGAILLSAIIIAYVLLDSKERGLMGGGQSATVGQETQGSTSDSSGAMLQVKGTDPAVEAIIQTVFKHIYLPSGDVQVQTVVKPDELRKVNPVFYEFAREGDRVLVYSDRAILYNPFVDKVLDVIHFPATKQ